LRGVGGDLPVPIAFLVLHEPMQQLLRRGRGEVGGSFLDFRQAHAPRLQDCLEDGKLKVESFNVRLVATAFCRRDESACDQIPPHYTRLMTRGFPRRPPRLSTVFQNTNPFYFVTFDTHERRPLLADATLHKRWIEFARRVLDHGAWVGRYVVMPDHVHVFVWLTTDTALTAWVQALKSVLGKELLRLGHQKPHWQEGFFDHLLRSSESYDQKWEYVRQNPVRKGLCAEPEDWPYQGEVTPLEWR